MKMKTAIICLLLFAGVAGAGFALAREPGDDSAITAQPLLAQSLAGDESKEVNAQLYTFPPGSSTPWHVHRDAHEIAYVLEGTLTFERSGEDPKQIKAGEAEYLAPNVVHRGMNQGDKPVRLFVVRIKPKQTPLAEEVPPPQ